MFTICLHCCDSASLPHCCHLIAPYRDALLALRIGQWNNKWHRFASATASASTACPCCCLPHRPSPCPCVHKSPAVNGGITAHPLTFYLISHLQPVRMQRSAATCTTPARACTTSTTRSMGAQSRPRRTCPRTPTTPHLCPRHRQRFNHR